MLFFKSWDRIVKENKELTAMIKERHNLIIDSCDWYNENISPLRKTENNLREKLVRSTEKEKREIEKEIDNLVETIKPLEKKHEEMEKELDELTNKIEKYMKDNLTEKELKKAKDNGWNV